MSDNTDIEPDDDDNHEVFQLDGFGWGGARPPGLYMDEDGVVYQVPEELDGEPGSVDENLPVITVAEIERRNQLEYERLQARRLEEEREDRFTAKPEDFEVLGYMDDDGVLHATPEAYAAAQAVIRVVRKYGLKKKDQDIKQSGSEEIQYIDGGVDGPYKAPSPKKK